jgi:hypothetical protein
MKNRKFQQEQRQQQRRAQPHGRRAVRADMDWIKGTVRLFDSYHRKGTKCLTKKELGPDGNLP